MSLTSKIISSAIFAGLALGGYYYFFQKICSPLSDDFFKESIPMEQRLHERGNIYQTWQKIDGSWNHCTTHFEKDFHF